MVTGMRDAASSFRNESLLIIAHKHINALLMCALLQEPLERFRSHIVEDTLPRPIPAYAIEGFRLGHARRDPPGN